MIKFFNSFLSLKGELAGRPRSSIMSRKFKEKGKEGHGVKSRKRRKPWGGGVRTKKTIKR